MAALSQPSSARSESIQGGAAGGQGNRGARTPPTPHSHLLLVVFRPLFLPQQRQTMASSFEAQATSTLRFWLNGTAVTLDGASLDPDSTLLDFIRSQGFTGTKLGCGEGGCGACTAVLQSRRKGKLQCVWRLRDKAPLGS